MIDYSETYALLKEAAAKGKHVVKMGGRCSGKTYALEQLLTTAIRENNGLHDCIKQLEETLQVYHEAMQEQVVRHGKWKKTFWCEAEDPVTGDMEKKYKHDCPVCGYHTGHQGSCFNYCPICGVKMDG